LIAGAQVLGGLQGSRPTRPRVSLAGTARDDRRVCEDARQRIAGENGGVMEVV